MDALFARAVGVARRVARMGSSSGGRPSPETRLALYGLYKQATEGDFVGDTANGDQTSAAGMKYEAWEAQRGLPRREAQLRYIQLLTESVKRFAGTSSEAVANIHELEQILKDAHRYGSLEALSSSSPPTMGYKSPASDIAGHTRAWSIGSDHSTPLSTQFLRRSAPSDFGLSLGDMRTEQLNQRPPELEGSNSNTAVDIDEDTIASLAWKRDVVWQLETITEEINSIRRQYSQPAQPSEGSTAHTSPTGPVPRLRHVNRKASLASVASELTKRGDDSSKPNTGSGSGNNTYTRDDNPTIGGLWEIAVALAARGTRRLMSMLSRTLRLSLASAARDVAGLLVMVAAFKAVSVLPPSLWQLPILANLRSLILRSLAALFRGFGLDLVPLQKAKVITI